MFNRRFLDSVRHRLINVMSPSLQSRKLKPKGVEDGFMVFVDYQNFYFHLRTVYEINAQQVNPLQLFESLAQENGFKIAEVMIFTGVPDAERDPKGSAMIQRRLAFFRHIGIQVFTAPMVYVNDRKEGRARAMERGVDLMLASELIKKVNAGVSKIMIVSNDKAFAQSVRIAADVAMGNGKVLEALSVIPEGFDPESLRMRGIGAEGIDFTTRIGLSQELMNDHMAVRIRDEGAIA
jgi:hypothetical protein